MIPAATVSEQLIRFEREVDDLSHAMFEAMVENETDEDALDRMMAVCRRSAPMLVVAIAIARKGDKS
jgi:hypothetical protein